MARHSEEEAAQREKSDSLTDSEPSIHRYQSQVSESERKFSDDSENLATSDEEQKTDAKGES